jgi:hypothetical protein
MPVKATAVPGLSQSSQAKLLARLQRLGNNLLAAQPDAGLGRGEGTLPATATDMITRIGPIIDQYAQCGQCCSLPRRPHPRRTNGRHLGTGRRSRFARRVGWLAGGWHLTGRGQSDVSQCRFRCRGGGTAGYPRNQRRAVGLVRRPLVYRCRYSGSI